VVQIAPSTSLIADERRNLSELVKREGIICHGGAPKGKGNPLGCLVENVGPGEVKAIIKYAIGGGPGFVCEGYFS